MVLCNNFDFINLDKNNQISKKELPYFYGNSWISNFNKFSLKRRIKIFILVKYLNNWDMKDNVIARGNNGGIIRQFSSNKISSKIVLKFYQYYYYIFNNNVKKLDDLLCCK